MGVELRHLNACLFLRRQLRLLKDLAGPEKSIQPLMNDLDSRIPDDDKGIPSLEVFETYLLDDRDTDTVLHQIAQDLLHLESTVLELLSSSAYPAKHPRSLAELEERSKFLGRKCAFEILESAWLVRPLPSEEVKLHQIHWITQHHFQFSPSYQTQGFLTIRNIHDHLLLENRGCPHMRWAKKSVDESALKPVLDTFCLLEADFLKVFWE